VPAKTIEHMIKKRHTCLNRRFSRAVNFEPELYIGLFGFSLDFGFPCHPDLLELAPIGALVNSPLIGLV